MDLLKVCLGQGTSGKYCTAPATGLIKQPPLRDLEAITRPDLVSKDPMTSAVLWQSVRPECTAWRTSSADLHTPTLTL